MLASLQPNNALHLTPPPPCPQRTRSAVLAVSQVSYGVRSLAAKGYWRRAEGIGSLRME